MARRTGGQISNVTGRIERGRMHRGSTEDVATFRENQVGRLAADTAGALVRRAFGRRS
jgi:hypothetical protein